MYAVAEHHGIGVGRTLVGAGKDVQTSQDDLRTTAAIPVGQFVSPSRKGKVNSDTNNLRNRMGRGRPVQ